MPTGADPIVAAQLCYAVRFASPVRLARVLFHANAVDDDATGAPNDFDVLGWRDGADGEVPDLLYATRRAPVIGTWSDGEPHWWHSFFVANGIMSDVRYSVLLFEFRSAVGGGSLAWPGWFFEFQPVADLPVCASAEAVSTVSQQDADRLAASKAVRSAYGIFERDVWWIDRMATMSMPVDVTCNAWTEPRTMVLRVAMEYPREPDNAVEAAVDERMAADLHYMMRLAEEDGVFCRTRP